MKPQPSCEARWSTYARSTRTGFQHPKLTAGKRANGFLQTSSMSSRALIGSDDVVNQLARQLLNVSRLACPGTGSSSSPQAPTGLAKAAMRALPLVASQVGWRGQVRLGPGRLHSGRGKRLQVHNCV